MMIDRQNAWNTSRAVNVGLLIAGLAIGPMVTVDDTGSFTDALILTLVFAVVIVFVTGFFSALLKQPMRRPTIDAPLYEFGEFIQQSFMSGLILCAMALGAGSYTLITGAGQGWRLFAAIGIGCVLGSMVSSWLFASRGVTER
ncbi:hypothetical protein [Stenotrophomonas sp. YAU14D1_LEIMI4_1]|uniref:hypothetical protein n=1 Tax=Stenotrophomonas sp. YAU14D1_LEIMI4_1 TaxID=2072407 RepID=UPI00131EF6D6|nr:hypothetical protein [Stenotrophomonas sp. YAU14D1_LEIMI4_1]